MGSLLLVLFVSTLAFHQALAQDELRASNDQANVGEGGAKPRNIYSRQYLSPHRMMHFGKRPMTLAPPTIRAVRQVYDPYLRRFVQVPDLPYVFSVRLDHGQVLQAIPDDASPQQDNGLLYEFERAQRLALPQQVATPGIKSQTEQRFLKLISKEEGNLGGSNNEAADGSVDKQSGERAQSLSNSQEDDDQVAINVSTRSMQRANTLSLPKAYISSLLYGRQGAASVPNYGNLNKKAEPKENFFMHFGRK